MISSLQRRQDSIFKLRLPWQKASRQAQPLLLSEDQFGLLVRKEVARCFRRPRHHEFSIIQIRPTENKAKSPNQESFLSALRQRLRITDELGCWRGALSILLPETGRDGALQVANVVEQLLEQQGLTYTQTILVYPWDDEILGRSTELDTIDDSFREQPHGFSDRGPPTSPGETTKPAQKSGAGTGNSLTTASVRTVTTLSFSEDNADKPFVVKNSWRTPWWKRTIDIVGSIILLATLSPLMALIAALIRWDSQGAPIFVQSREGKDGKPFKIFKFRTMRIGAESEQKQLRTISEQDGPAFKLEDDPRVTRIGRFLRKSCLDELPQLWNVLRGEMSFVGPRPLPIAESVQCRMWHRQRLQVVPGLTCIWQVFGGRKVSFEEWMRMDLDYIQRQSLWLDLKLIFFTAMKVVMQKGSV